MPSLHGCHVYRGNPFCIPTQLQSPAVSQLRDEGTKNKQVSWKNILFLFLLISWIFLFKIFYNVDPFLLSSGLSRWFFFFSWSILFVLNNFALMLHNEVIYFLLLFQSFFRTYLESSLDIFMMHMNMNYLNMRTKMLRWPVLVIRLLIANWLSQICERTIPFIWENIIRNGSVAIEDMQTPLPFPTQNWSITFCRKLSTFFLTIWLKNQK